MSFLIPGSDLPYRGVAYPLIQDPGEEDRLEEILRERLRNAERIKTRRGSVGEYHTDEDAADYPVSGFRGTSVE